VKSVAIAGFASITRDYVRAVKVDEVWSMNMIHSSPTMREVFPLEIDRLFDIHPVWMLQAEWYSKNNDHWGWLTRTEHKYPVYMLEAYPEVHNSLRFPIEEISERYLANIDREGEPVNYYTSSFCYMLALAVFEGFTDIYISGFDMGSDTEYIYQKSGAEFWIGLASQVARVHLPKNTSLLRAKLYGYESGQLINRSTLEEYYGWYMNRLDEIATDPPKDSWVELQLLTGAITYLEDALKGETTSRQVLEAHKNNWDHKRRKLAQEVNTIQAQAWERTKHKEGIDDLSKRAFDSYKYMIRYDGALQVVEKLIMECDLQKPDKKLYMRQKFQQFSEVSH